VAQSAQALHWLQAPWPTSPDFTSRLRYNLYRSLISLTNEWGKAIVAAVLATVLSLIAASLATSGNQKMAEQKVGVVSA